MSFANLCVAIMHSGITLAPVVAREIATILTEDRDSKWLHPYAIERFETGRETAAS